MQWVQVLEPDDRGRCRLGFGPNPAATAVVRLDAHYQPFYRDFGPPNLAAISRGLRRIANALAGGPACVTCVGRPGQNESNAALMLGAYLILTRGLCSAEVERRFAPVLPRLPGYCDAGTPPDPFRLTVADCWRALERARGKGWWPDDPDAYIHYDSPLNADLHFLVPAKLALVRGPRGDIAGTHRDIPIFGGRRVRRDFSPAYLGEVLRAEGVTTVVRIGPPNAYPPAALGEGLALVDLPYFRDIFPPSAVVQRFAQLMDAAQGAVAVHGRSTSCARAGTLAALYLVRTHGFTAREAIAWARIVRPGCVVGEQQEYLCGVEVAVRAPTGRAGMLRPGCAAGDQQAGRTGMQRTWSSDALPRRRHSVAVATLAGCSCRSY